MFEEEKYSRGLPFVEALVVKGGGGRCCLLCVSTLIYTICCINCIISSFCSAMVRKFIFLCDGELSHYNISQTDFFIIVTHRCFSLIRTLTGKGICMAFRSYEIRMIDQFIDTDQFYVPMEEKKFKHKFVISNLEYIMQNIT